MKNILHIICLVCFVGLFSSCLQEINSTYDPGPTPAVVRIHGDSAKMMANTRYGWLYDDKFSSYSDGKCLLIRFSYNPSENGNKDAQKRGYYEVNLTNDMKVTQKDAVAEQVDINVLLPKEQTIVYAVNPNDKEYYHVIENFLFLPSVCHTTRLQPIEWQLMYDPNQQPIVENGKSIYALFLRAVAQTDPLENAQPELVPEINAFNLASFLMDVRAHGGREGDISIQIHYIDRINPQDSTRFAWNATEPLLLKTTK